MPVYRQLTLLLFLAAGGLFLASCATPSHRATGSTRITLMEASAANPRAHFAVHGFPIDRVRQFAESISSPTEWNRLFSVYVVPSGAPSSFDPPPMLGTWSVRDGQLVFEPQYPLEPGLSYRAVVRSVELPGNGPAEPMETVFALAAPSRKPTAAVTAVYPSTPLLPENQLKFYLHFSAPMSRGGAYSHVHLLRSSGEEVDLPFLVLDEELWDYEGKRLTLFFDPGRVKRELLPREEEGPSILEGERYTLVIDRRMRDAEGNPLKRTFRKEFRVGPPDYASPDPKAWKLTRPRADTTQPFQVTFPEPLDHALLQRLLRIRVRNGPYVDGTIRVDQEETRWHFTPVEPWPKQPLELVVDSTLEDLAGNSIERPFEVDIFPRVQTRIEPPDQITLPIPLTR